MWSLLWTVIGPFTGSDTEEKGERMDIGRHLVDIPIWDKSNLMGSVQKPALLSRNNKAGYLNKDLHSLSSTVTYTKCVGCSTHKLAIEWAIEEQRH